jgi:hypothetical protein
MPSPSILITSDGDTTSLITIDRLNGRMERLKLALAKPSITPERRAILQAELTKLEAVKNP